MRNRFLIAAAVIVGVLILAVILLPFVISGDQFRPAVQTQLKSALGREVTLGRLSFSVIGGELKAADIAIADDAAFGGAPFVTAKSLDVGVEMMPLILSRQLHIRSITLQQPQVTLLRSKSGKWNFSSLGQNGTPSAGHAPAAGAAPAPDFTVGKLEISDGRIVIGGSSRQQVYDKVNLTAENVSFQSSFPFRLRASTPGGGSLDFDGSAGPINPSDTAESPFQAKMELKKVDLSSTGFLDPSSGLAGTLDFNGTVRSDGKVAQTEGTAKLDKLRLVKNGAPAGQPITIDYASNYDLKAQTGQLTKGLIKTGKSTVDLSGAYDMHGDSPVLHMKVAAPNTPVPDVEALLPAFGITLPAGSSLQGGTVNTHLAVDGPADQLITTGDVNLSNAKLSGFGLASKMAALSAFTGVRQSPDTLIQMLSSNLRVAPDGIRTENVKLIVAELGTITGSGTIAPNNALNFRMLASLPANGGIANLAARAGFGGGSGNGIPFLIEGTTANPAFRLDAGSMVRTLGASQGGNQPGNLGGILGGLLGKKKTQ